LQIKRFAQIPNLRNFAADIHSADRPWFLWRPASCSAVRSRLSV